MGDRLPVDESEDPGEADAEFVASTDGVPLQLCVEELLSVMDRDSDADPVPEGESVEEGVTACDAVPVADWLAVRESDGCCEGVAVCVCPRDALGVGDCVRLPDCVAVTEGDGVCVMDSVRA